MRRLLFGPIAGAVFVAGVVGLPFAVPGYSQVRQTVSEIGEEGSPARVPFTLLLCAVAVCILLFSSGLRAAMRGRGASSIGAYVTGATALSVAGVGVFAFPHPLHNVFGLSELVGYQAPLFVALGLRVIPDAKGVVRFSWLMYALIWIAIAMNLTAIFRSGAVWSHLKPCYGLVQRALFATWFAWSAGTGWLLFRQGTEAGRR
ncbi:MAG TPA: DUF998 domain-containing protein [Polyangiaceae bacterium]